MSMRITQENNSNPIQMTQELSSTVMNGVANTPITISSLRESAYAEPSSNLCQYFSTFINWIKDLFLSLFGSKSSNDMISSESTPSANQTASSLLIETGQSVIDNHFAQLDQPFPLKAVICIQFNDRVLTAPFSNITSDPSAFKEEAKRALQEALRSQNFHQGDAFKIKTFFLKSATADTHQVPLSQGPFYQIRTYLYSCGHLGELNSTGSDISRVLNIRETQDYMFIGAVAPSQDSAVVQFLMS